MLGLMCLTCELFHTIIDVKYIFISFNILRYYKFNINLSQITPS